MLAPIGFLKGGAAPFNYATNFGAKLLDWWRLDLGVTLHAGTLVKTVTGQHAGIVLGNPDFGATSYPEFAAASANLGGKPSARWQTTTKNLQINFGMTVLNTAALLMVYYTPTFATAGDALTAGPIFGTADGAYQAYSDTQLKIRDITAGVALTADAAANWAGAHSMIATFDEVTKGSVRRDGGVDRRASIQAGYCDVVNWKGMVFGPGTFGHDPEVGYELAEVVALTDVPTFGEMNPWLAHVDDFYGIPYAPAA